MQENVNQENINVVTEYYKNTGLNTIPILAWHFHTHF